MRGLTNVYDFRFEWTATAAIGIHPTKAWLSQLVKFKKAIWTWGHFRRIYAIKFRFKLEKNDATETYGMLQTAFGASCMNRSSVFEWHKRVKEGRMSLRDDERCGRSKEVRTPELIGQIKNVMDNDRRLSIETISGRFNVSVELYTQLFARNWRCGRFARSLSQRRSERKTLSSQQGDCRADQFRSRSSWCQGDLQWKLDLLLWPRDN